MPSLRKLAWLTSLSLDAPLVAIVWQRALAEAISVNLEWRHHLLVFLSVWLGYSADRWLDARKHDLNLTQRHAFHASRRWTLLAIWICVLALSVSLAAVSLHAAELRRGIALAVASILVTAIIQLGPKKNRHGVTKSLLTSGLVTASVLVFLPTALVRAEIPTVVMIFFLFNLNCSCIHYWDLPIDSKQESNHNGKWLKTNAIVSFILATVSTIALIPSPLAIYSSLSIAGLFLLHLKHKRLDADLKRSLADIILLTPALRIAYNLARRGIL